jgi:undecaprenyl-diphosphatase
MDRPSGAGIRRLERFTGRSLAGLLVVLGLGAGFGLLLMLVRLEWGPLHRVDRGAAASLNDVVSENKLLVTVLKAISMLGGGGILVWLVVVVAASMLIRRQLRLAIYLVVTGLGASMLDPSLKLIVGRLRPVVDVPVESAPGNSFPSGHALGSMVVYGAVLLVFLPVVSRRMRPVLIGVMTTIVVLVGFTRVALGVHYISDVLAGWVLGMAWLGATGYAFRLWRREAGDRARPVKEGMEPEAAENITPAPEEQHVLPHPRSGVAEILTGFVLVFGVLFVVGEFFSQQIWGFDAAIPKWLAEQRNPDRTAVSWWLSKLGDTQSIVAVALLFCPLAVATLRRWRPAVFVALVMIGEGSLFLLVSRAVGRDRPEVEQLDGSLPTSSFPSGHIAATICLYTAMALVVMPCTRRWWRWLFVAAAIVMPLLVILSRLYRGMHYPTDVLGALLLSTLWIGLLWWVVKPSAPDRPEAEGDDSSSSDQASRPLTVSGARA